MNAWRRIYDANRDRIDNPDLIQPGWTLTIPE
jgi:nucleoid-associated protein YgaU